MADEPTEPRICCPACHYSLDEAEQEAAACADCGAVLDLDALRSRKEELAEKDVRDRRILSAWRIGAVFGAIMMLVGLALIIAEMPLWIGMRRGGWATGIAVSVILILYRRHEREPLGPLLVPLGIFWLGMGLLYCWTP